MRLRVRVGDRVVSERFEYTPEEWGTVEAIKPNGLYIIRLDRRHRAKGDDGRRVVPRSRMRMRDGA